MNEILKLSQGTVDVSEYKGHPTLAIVGNDTGGRPFTFGKAKARKLDATIQALGPEKFAQLIAEFAHH